MASALALSACSTTPTAEASPTLPPPAGFVSATKVAIPADPADVASVDAIVAALYDVISGPAGEKRDWDRMRSLFSAGGRLMPLGPSGLRVGGVEDYIRVSGPVLEEKGFFEREIGRTTEQYGGIAHIFSAYEARETEGGPVILRGINSIQLARHDGRWWVVSVMWQPETPDNPVPARYLAPAAAAEPQVPAPMQWLYGSGEGGAASIQTYHGFRDYVLAAARNRPADSVVLAEGATFASPRFVPCGAKPLAVVLDADETAIQNLGFEYALARRGKDYDRDLHHKWMAEGERELAPMPGAVSALKAIRAAGVKVLFNTNRDAEYAANTEDALNGAGLGPAVHLDTLFLRGDPPGDREKDGRRALIAERYCVLAMAGDQLGDFSDLFNERGLAVPERRRAATTAPFARLWGNGWFLLSNPVYGPGLRGGYDDVFPAGTRWADPQGGQD